MRQTKSPDEIRAFVLNRIPLARVYRSSLRFAQLLFQRLHFANDRIVPPAEVVTTDCRTGVNDTADNRDEPQSCNGQQAQAEQPDDSIQHCGNGADSQQKSQRGQSQAIT